MYDFRSSTSQLPAIFHRLRREIVRNIAANQPKGYLALGPALMYIEDPDYHCLYNWSEVNWEELKLGPLIREILREIYDIARFAEKDPNGSLIQEISRIKDDAKSFLDRNIDIDFDDYPKFKSIFDRDNNFLKFARGTDRILAQISKLSLNDFMVHGAVGKIDCYVLGNVLQEIYFLNQGRYHAFLDLKNLIENEYTEEDLEQVEKYIENHPRHVAPQDSEPSKARWQSFITDIKKFRRESDDPTEYNRLMSEAIRIFCDLPQESDSSDSLKSLKTINHHQHVDRSDSFNIRLGDLNRPGIVGGSIL
ncbi:MAG: hypothetical protein ACYDHW_16715 [Syntrophorhabdaceae bacterium]